MMMRIKAVHPSGKLAVTVLQKNNNKPCDLCVKEISLDTNTSNKHEKEYSHISK